MRPTIPWHGHWPPPPFAIAAVLVAGGALLFAAIVIQRKSLSTTVATIALLIAALWNGAIVFAFMSPHNRHVFHLATHRGSVILNAALGIVWLFLCACSVHAWFRRTA